MMTIPKLVKQTPLCFGPLEFTVFTTWKDFLQAVAEACHASKEGLDVQSLCWKWIKPANCPQLPLSTLAAFASLKKKLTGTQPTIVLTMKAPQPVVSKEPDWSATAANAGPWGVQSEPVLAAEDPADSHKIKGKFDDVLDEIVEKLKHKYPFDGCTDHPGKRCFHYRVTNKHFDLTNPRLKVWAAAIYRKDTTYETIPITSNLFKDKDAMPLKMAKTPASPAVSKEPDAGPGRGQLMTYHHPHYPISPFSHPFLSPAHLAMHGYASMPFYGQPNMHISPPPLRAGPPGMGMMHMDTQDFYAQPSSSPPPGCDLDDYCQACGHDENVKSKLENLGFVPGDNLEGTPSTAYEHAGFKYFEWQRVLKADKKFWKDTKRNT
ncbi:hypothetical protein JB92DRAFT_354852 [Gautieria morchelliformis]|nr:hypothetical protein JB92DRAFT_354852 [Gautieria morchelliformis]